jgi:hypothetical protein
MGSVAAAGDQLTDCVIRLGGGTKTKVHCVGDGASWIVEQVERCFGTQGNYLIDFYHVSQYLAAAAEAIASRHPRQWLHRQQNHLKTNRLKTVFKTLAAHVEPVRTAETEAPVRACHRYLSNRIQHLDYRKALRASRSVSALQRQVSAALAQPVETAHRFVAQQTRHHVDETSWRERHRWRWLWVDATPQVTAFRILRGRGQQQAREILGPKFAGVVTTDRYNAYHWVSDERRRLCWAHLKRDFQAFAERAGPSAEIGQALLAQVKDLFRYWHEWRSGRRDWLSLQQVMQPVQARVKQLLERGLTCGHAKTVGTCRQILKRETSLWAFTRVTGVEPTNNAAERSLRRAVLWRPEVLRHAERGGLAWLTAACMAASGTATPCWLLPNTS